jgi:hypothetical protein
MEHSAALDAYVVAYAEPTGVHVAAVDRTSLAFDVAPIDLLPPGAGVADDVDLSLAISGLSVAVATQTVVGGRDVPDVAVVDSSRTVRHLWDGSDASAGSAAAVGSLSGSPVVGVARIVGGELRFEIYQWVGAVLLAAFTVAAPTEGDILDVEAEPTPGSYLVARKARAGGGPATVTRIRCSLSRP